MSIRTFIDDVIEWTVAGSIICTLAVVVFFVSVLAGLARIMPHILGILFIVWLMGGLNGV